ncbi:MAG: 3-isopropylmalate dehydratase [Atribacterota bacterium]|nr:3-isopropylmalate dehydratase [Atribacterota bacterium]
MSFVIKGRVWVFGNDISTDLMAPGIDRWASWKEAKCHVLEVVNPSFPKEVKEGDIIVAGRNFGCGSSRERAPRNLMNLGIKCIIGESFGRIFFRNSIALGIPIIYCQNVSSIFEQGDVAVIDIENALVLNHSKNLSLKCKPLSVQIIEMLKEGGIVPLLKKQR